MVVLGEGEVEKTKRYAFDVRETEKFLKNCQRYALDFHSRRSRENESLKVKIPNF